MENILTFVPNPPDDMNFQSTAYHQIGTVKIKCEKSRTINADGYVGYMVSGSTEPSATGALGSILGLVRRAEQAK